MWYSYMCCQSDDSFCCISAGFVVLVHISYLMLLLYVLVCFLYYFFIIFVFFFFFFSSRRRHTRSLRDWSQTCALPISLIVSSPASEKWLGSPLNCMPPAWKLISGKRSTSKKSGERRWASRSSFSVSRLATLIEPTTDGSSPATNAPSKSLNRPWTVWIIMCLTRNSISECAGSTDHDPFDSN